MMEDFFAGVEGRWPAGRADYAWHWLPPDPATMRRLLVDPFIELTGRHEFLAAVKPERMHVTVQHVAPVDQVTDGELDDIVALVNDECSTIAPFPVTIDSPEVWPTAVAFPITPGAPIRRLWELTVAAARRVCGERFPIVPQEYAPHLTLAYATGSGDHKPLRAWLADCDFKPVRLQVTALTLVAQRHNRQAITWNAIDVVQLAGGQLRAGQLRGGQLGGGQTR